MHCWWFSGSITGFLEVIIWMHSLALSPWIFIFIILLLSSFSLSSQLLMWDWLHRYTKDKRYLKIYQNDNVIRQGLNKVVCFHLCFRIKAYSGIPFNRKIIFSDIWGFFFQQTEMLISYHRTLVFSSIRKSILVLFFSIYAFIHVLFQGLDCICEWSWLPLLLGGANHMFSKINSLPGMGVHWNSITSSLHPFYFYEQEILICRCFLPTLQTKLILKKVRE